MLFSCAIGYGTLIYGEVSSKLGGAKPRTVFLGLKENLSKKFPTAFPADAGESLSGRLVHQTDKAVFLSVNGYTIRVRNEDISVITVIPELDQYFWAEYFSQRLTE
jgi:hypothetical protein